MLNKKPTTQLPSKTALPIKPVAEMRQPQSYAIYGRSGTGKTTLAGTFPKPVLVLDINDKGVGSIADVKDVYVMEIESIEDIEDVYYYLREGEHLYKTVVFDTVTEMQRLLMREVADKRASSSGSGTISQRDWGEIGGVMSKWISDFRNLDMEVVFLAQERVSDMENLDTQTVMPSVGAALMPSVATTLNAAVNVIANTFVHVERTTKLIEGKQVRNTKTQYCLRVGPNPVYITKVRKPKASVAPDHIVDPTYDKLINIVKGKANEKSPAKN